MKSCKFILFVFTTLFTIINTHGAAADERNRQILLDDEETGGRGRLISRGNGQDQADPVSMEKISEMFPQVQQEYQNCLQPDSSGNPPPSGNALSECVWNALDSATHEKIYKYLDEEKERQQSENPNAETKVTSAEGSFRQTRSKTTRKLEEYLKERLSNILYDNEAQGAKVLSDHAQFYKLYKSQIGQNIIRVAADECIHANPDPALKYDPNNRTASGDESPGGFYGFIDKHGTYQDQKHKDYNKSTIANTSTQTTSAGQTRNVSQSYAVFEACLKTIPTQCKLGISEACKVLKYMELGKNAIKDLDGIKDELEKRNGDESSTSKRYAQNLMKSKEVLNNKNLKDALNLTSADIEKANLQETVDEETAILEECKTQTNPASGDCALYLTDHEEKAKIEQEFMIRQIAMEKRVQETLGDGTTSPEEQKNAIIKVLTEEGLSEEKIEEYLAKHSGNLNDATSDIKARYEKQRAAIIDDLKNSIKTANSDAGSNSAPTSSGNSPFDELAAQSQNKVEDLKESLQFANVVSAFIQVENDQGEVMSNTAALASELNNITFDSDPNSSNNMFTSEEQVQQLRDLAGSGDDNEDLPEFQAENIENIMYGLERAE